MNLYQDIEHCLEVLKNGGIFLYPSDTIWGIGCDATNADAVRRIFELKHRSANKSMIVLTTKEVGTKDYTDEAVEVPAYHKPLSIIYGHAKNLAPQLIAGDGSVGIRTVNDTFCEALINSFGKPIVSTSANFSNSASPRMYEDICEEIKNGVDYVAHHKRNDLEPKEPSAVARITDGKLEFIRE